MSAVRRCSLRLVAAAVAVSLGAAADEGWSRRVRERLEALSPDRPESYIALAEDLVDRASSGEAQADRALARRLAALAGAIDPPGTGRSAALFLADNADSDAARTRFVALARALGAGQAREDGAARSAATLALARAFEAYGRGDAARALEALAVPGAAELLDANPAVLGGGAARFRADCAAMSGRVTPPLDPAQADALRLLVAATLAGGPRGWGEAIALGGDAPLPEVDVRDPGSMFGVDPSECLWRDGRWSRAAP